MIKCYQLLIIGVITMVMQGKKGVILGIANKKSIAYGIAEACKKQGAEVAITFLNERFGEKLAPIADELGCSDKFYPCDVSNPSEIVALRESLKKDFSSLQDSIDKRNVLIFKLRGDLLQSDKRLKSANDEVNRLQKEKKDTDKKIEDLLKNPIRRNDDDLINSLKNKVKP
jgi:predicted transglutaminase-like cysteine proteinase